MSKLKPNRFREFIAPLFANPRIALKGFIKPAHRTGLGIATVLIIEKVTSHIETENFDQALTMIWIFLGALILYYISSRFIKSRGRVELTHSMYNTIQKQRMSKFVKLDPSQTEKL